MRMDTQEEMGKKPIGKGIPIEDTWNCHDGDRLDSVMIKSFSKKTGYPTEKPIGLLERIIKASSNKGDMVLDAFCGCSTTMVAAEKLNRKWIGIDVSVKAYELVKIRLQEELEKKHSFLQGTHKQKDLGITFTTDKPTRTDTNGESLLEKKFVYVISNPNDAINKWYNVGITNNIKRRLYSYQTSSLNRDFKVYFEYKTEHFRQIEKYIHSKFENRNEWVKSDLQSIVKAIKEFDLNEYNKTINEEQKELDNSRIKQ